MTRKNKFKVGDKVKVLSFDDFNLIPDWDIEELKRRRHFVGRIDTIKDVETGTPALTGESKGDPLYLVAVPFAGTDSFWNEELKLVRKIDPLTKKYRGYSFVFHSPFENTPGWEDGDVGKIILRRTKSSAVDLETSDLWQAYNTRTRRRGDIWGGEAFDIDTGNPIIVEHQFLNWRPS